MRGSHRIIVESKKVKYDFTIKRNITILTGDSGSGKTVLIDRSVNEIYCFPKSGKFHEARQKYNDSECC